MHPLVRRLFSPAGFALVGCCFALPFVSVSCTPQPEQTMSATYTGIDLAAGDRPRIEVSDEFRRGYEPIAKTYGLPGSTGAVRDQLTRPIRRQPLMWAALGLAALATVLCGLWRPWFRSLVAAGAALVVGTVLVGGEVIAVHAARTRFAGDIAPYVSASGGSGTAGPYADIEPRYGFWLAVLLLAVLAIGNGWVLFRRSSQ
jgi:hypothetical protein